jgi:hypothetical protein
MNRIETSCAALLLVAAACGSNGKGAPSTPEPEATVAPAKPEAPPATDVITVEGFQTPESVLYDADADVYLVSNINGDPLGADGNGFISRVSPDGTIAELKWIDGAKEGITLNGPKGMALFGGKLYVADITAVRIFDAVTGAPAGEVVIEGATFVNDVAAGADGVFVSDSGLTTGFQPSGTDAVYSIDAAGKATALLADKDLGKPNGLYADDSGVWVVTFGTGELFLVADGKKQRAQTLPKGQLDGLVALPDGRLLISSWQGQSLLAGPAQGPFTEIITGVKAPADIGFDSKRNRVLIPLFQDDVVQIRGL